MQIDVEEFGGFHLSRIYLDQIGCGMRVV